MIRIELTTLVERLNPVCRHMLEQAAALCIQHQGAEIRIEHLLMNMLDTPLCDVRQICKRADVDVQALSAQLQPTVADSDFVAAGYPSFSPLLVEWLQDSWLLASAEFQHSHLRSGVLLLVLLMMPNRYLSTAASRPLAHINRELLRQQFDEWVKASSETPVAVNASATTEQAAAVSTQLGRYTQNVTEAARQGQLDPVLCRDREIDVMIDILSRRRKNNPMVVGEAGVGKSALIEGLALRIVAGLVPERLRDVELLTLDLGAMQAGASVKGEFEKRFKGVMQEVKDLLRPIILFIDEAHTLIGAGNQAGGLDVSNLLKPALARGELRTIAATTWSEYKKYVEKDAALSRRFQRVNVGEPSADESAVILRGLRAIYEKAHGVLIDEDALHAAAHLSARYISGRQLPDKAIDVLDTACARVAINLTTPPRAVSQLQTRLHQQEMEIAQLERQRRIGLGETVERLATLRAECETCVAELAQREADWQQQKHHVQRIIALRSALLADERPEATQLDVEQSDVESPDDIEAMADELAACERELEALQQASVLVSPHVDKTQIAAVIAEWTGVPLNRISQGEMEVVTRLPEFLGETIKGQTLAIAHLHKHLLTARADLRRPGRPLGAFLLVGPSGVGKTETVLQIADLLFGGRNYLTTINMSEYQEKHTVSRLIGSPPGYVGFGEGGVLTEAIRQKPYSVVLLDEVEKAHPDVLNLFYQAFDKGELADGEGRVIDCRNVVFFLTSNLGYQTIVNYAAHASLDVQDARSNDLLDALYPELAAFFKPALLARMEVIPYLPLDHATMVAIVHGKLARLVSLLQQRFGAETVIDEAVPEAILRLANRSENGARMLESVIDGALLPPVSLQLLQRLSAGESVRRVHFHVKDDQFQSEVEG